MAEGIIKDGRTGNTLEIDKFFRAQTFATSRPQEAHATILGQSFIFSTIQSGTLNTLTVGAGEGGIMLAVKNGDSERNLRIQVLEISTDQPASDGGICIVTKNPIFGTVTDAVSASDANLNFTSSKPSNIVGHVWDEVGITGISGITGGEDIIPNIINFNKSDFINSSILLTPGNSIAVKYFAGTSATEVAINMRAFFEGVS